MYKKDDEYSKSGINFDFASLYSNVQKKHSVQPEDWQKILGERKRKEREKKLKRILGDES